MHPTPGPFEAIYILPDSDNSILSTLPLAPAHPLDKAACDSILSRLARYNEDSHTLLSSHCPSTDSASSRSTLLTIAGHITNHSVPELVAACDELIVYAHRRGQASKGDEKKRWNKIADEIASTGKNELGQASRGKKAAIDIANRKRDIARDLGFGEHEFWRINFGRMQTTISRDLIDLLAVTSGMEKDAPGTFREIVKRCDAKWEVNRKKNETGWGKRILEAVKTEVTSVTKERANVNDTSYAAIRNAQELRERDEEANASPAPSSSGNPRPSKKKRQRQRKEDHDSDDGEVQQPKRTAGKTSVATQATRKMDRILRAPAQRGQVQPTTATASSHKTTVKKRTKSSNTTATNHTNRPNTTGSVSNVGAGRSRTQGRTQEESEEDEADSTVEETGRAPQDAKGLGGTVERTSPATPQHQSTEQTVPRSPRESEEVQFALAILDKLVAKKVINLDDVGTMEEFDAVLGRGLDVEDLDASEYQTYPHLVEFSEEQVIRGLLFALPWHSAHIVDQAKT